PLRVKSYLAGSLVGEIGLYIGRSRSATVIADTPVSAWKLSADSFARMAQEDVALAMQLHCVVVRLLGTRLSDTNRMLAAYAH
ncbi:MAG: cyclic nucleotide-binding domain-containing protein, partial [Alphaproteobacteria bacterium]